MAWKRTRVIHLSRYTYIITRYLRWIIIFGHEFGRRSGNTGKQNLQLKIIRFRELDKYIYIY